MLRPNLPTLYDKEGSAIPAGFPNVIDAHVHVFPSKIFTAIRRWFDENAWHNRYQLSTTEVFSFLLSHGVSHIIALQYAHKPGIARDLNQYMIKKCQEYPDQITGMATVFPGEKNSGMILQEAFDLGLSGLKLHAHVQCFDINSADTYLLFDICQSNKMPAIIHFGKEPKSANYRCDPYQLCGAEKLERVLNNFPDLKICVPHLGFSETFTYKELIEKYDTLWLDTTMVLTDYFPMEEHIEIKRYRVERILYGSDFPNIPYEWDRELKWLSNSELSDYELEQILNKNANDFFDLDV